MQSSLQSFFLAGFECSAHTRRDGVRVDLLASTGHARLAKQDYEQVYSYGMKSARDGIRWHLVERSPNVYDWSSWLPMLQASQHCGMQIIWDLCHYNWPDHLDIWSAAFVDHLARYARAAAQIIRDETGMPPLLCPINEISFWAWAGGDVAYIGPLREGCADELKRQLVRATIASIDAIRSVDPAARILLAEPLIHVAGNPDIPGDVQAAELFRLAQFEAADMISGRLEPQLGGRPEYLDIIGANFYPHNQWYLHGNTIPLGHHSYRSLSEMLGELYRRYSLPLLISETGAEGSARPYWLHHVCSEVSQSIRSGVPIEGICLYPVLDYHGWDNDRVCRAGLLSMPDGRNHRAPYLPLLEELRRQESLISRIVLPAEQLAG